MRVGAFVLAAQFPGQGQQEPLLRAVRTAEAVEEAGLDSVWLAEHHFVPYGVCPSAVTLAAMLLGRTRRIGVGTAVSVLPNAHPVALGEQAALLHLVSGGRFTLGVGRGGPWVDLEVLGGGLEAYERDFPEALDLLLRWLREPRVGADGERYRFREVDVVPRCDEPLPGAAGTFQDGERALRRVPPERTAATGAPSTSVTAPGVASPAGYPPAGTNAGTGTGTGTGTVAQPRPEPPAEPRRGARSEARTEPRPEPRPEPRAGARTGPRAAAGAVGAPAGSRAPAVILACTSPRGVRLAARRCLPMLLGMHCGDEEKAEIAAMWRREARDAGHAPPEIERAAALHVSAGVAQVGDSAAEAAETLTKAMPGWFRSGLGAHRTVDDRERTMRDPVAYTELLCRLHPVGTPEQCADRLAATSERTGIGRFALLVEGSGDLAATERNVQRLGEEVLPHLPPGR